MDCSEEDWDFSFDLNVKSMHRTIKAFLPAMLAGGGGSIVNISSCAALRPPANRYVYSASKAAVSLLTRAIALDFITQGIRCNSICPGTVETPSMLDRAAAAGPDGREKFVAARRWAGWAPRRKSRPWRSISRATKARSPPASTSSSMAATCSDIHATKGFRHEQDRSERPPRRGHRRRAGFRARHYRALRGLRRQGRDLGSRPAVRREDRQGNRRRRHRAQGRRLGPRRGRAGARRHAQGAGQDRHPGQQCRHCRHQQDGVGDRSRRMAQGAAHQSRRALRLLQGHRARR